MLLVMAKLDRLELHYSLRKGIELNGLPFLVIDTCNRVKTQDTICLLMPVETEITGSVRIRSSEHASA